MRVALTGATGYLGSRLALAFLRRGFEVSALVRSGELPAGVRSVSGDLRDPGAASRLVEGAEAVVHAAAVYRTASHPDRYYREVNVSGTEHLLEAAARFGVGRFVHTSTVGVHGHIAAPPGDESSPIAPGDIYQETKAEAEALALAFGKERGVPVTVIRPGAIYGPGEKRLLKLFRAIARGHFAPVGTGRPFYHPVFVDDLVDGYFLCLSSEAAVGEAFILGGASYLSQRELWELIARHTGGRILPFRIPAAPVLLAGRVLETLLVPFGIEPPLHSRRVEFFVKSRAFTIEKARRLLGYDPKVDLDEGIRRTVESYREAGWL